MYSCIKFIGLFIFVEYPSFCSKIIAGGLKGYKLCSQYFVESQIFIKFPRSFLWNLWKFFSFFSRRTEFQTCLGHFCFKKFTPTNLKIKHFNEKMSLICNWLNMPVKHHYIFLVQKFILIFSNLYISELTNRSNIAYSIYLFAHLD